MLVLARKNILLRMSAVVVGAWVFELPAAESIYKWVDDDGSVHFSDQPPPELNKSEKSSIESSPSDEVVREAQRKRESLRLEQKSRQEQRIAARQQEQLRAESEQAQREDSQRRCREAQAEIQNLEQHMPIYYMDESGNRVFLDDKKRVDFIEHYRRETKLYCQ